MRRFWLLLPLLALALTACGGSSAVAAVSAPPNATVIEKSDNEQINAYITRLESDVPATMEAQSIKNTAEQPITQTVYQSTDSLQTVQDYYKTLLTQGWTQAKGMPLSADGVLIDGYEHGNTSFVVNVVEQKQLGGESGVLIYTAQGTK